MPKVFNFKVLLSLIIFSIISQVACTEKREERFVYREGADLFKISDYDNRYFELNTNSKKENIFYQQTSKSKVTRNGKEQLFNYVNYKTDAGFFPADIRFVGLTNHRYKLVYQITNTNLIISKVGSGEEIPFEERASAQKMQSNYFAVPLVSYRLSGLYVIDNVRNDSNQKTHILKEYPVTSKSQATHFRIDLSSREEINSENKQTIFDKNYFDGTWHTTTVISKVAEEDSFFLGQNVSFDSKQESADKIVFVNEKDRLIGLNANYDKRINVGEGTEKRNNLEETLLIPIEHFEFKRDFSNGKFNEYSDSKVPWEDRKYISLDLTKTKSLIIENLKGTPSVSELVIEDDFFMYSLQFSGAKVTLSFKKALSSEKNEYKPLRYFSDDFKYFGFFTTQKKSLNSYEKYRREDFEKNVFINRINPKLNSKTGKKEITFYLTESSDTSTTMLDSARKAIFAWNEAFHKAGLVDVDIKLDESMKVVLGDVRYNSINLIKTVTSSSLFGVGPTVADPDTGEIISATTNVHITSIKTSLVSELRKYIKYIRGELKANYPLSNTNLIISLPINPTNSQLTSVRNQGELSLNYSSFSNPQRTSISSKMPATNNFRFENINLALRANFSNISNSKCDFNNTSGNLVKDVETMSSCKQLREYAVSNQTNLKTEIEALELCADGLLPTKVQATLVHELGHNFGLRHNFAGSIDFENYARKIDSKAGSGLAETVTNSSSVMEYTSLNEDRLTFVGPYDIEAIRFGYASQIKDINNNILSLNTNVSIDQNLIQLGVLKKPFLFCTDEHVEYASDPMCQRFDSGKTPLEVVTSLINEYNVLFASENFRYDREKSPSPDALKEYKEKYIFNKLGMFYEKWRVILTNYIGIENQNLEIYNIESYAKLLEQMSQNPGYANEYRLYKPAADKVFNFLLQIAFSPSRYCLFKNSENEFKAVEFTILATKYLSKTGRQLTSCKNLDVENLYSNIGFRYFGDVGNYYDNQKFAVDMHNTIYDYNKSRGAHVDTLDSYWDIIGIKYDRDIAQSMLNTRFTETKSNYFFAKQRHIFSAFLDEPQYRETIINKIINRTLNGLSLADLKLGETPRKNEYVPIWSEELEQLKSLWNMSKLGLSTVGKELMNEQRVARWQIIKTTETTLVNSAVEKVQLSSGQYAIALTEKNDVAIKLIQRFKWLTEQINSNSKEYLDNKIEYDAQYSLIKHIIDTI